MLQWTTVGGHVCCAQWANALRLCLLKLSKMRLNEHEITLGDLVDLIEFTLGGHLRCKVRKRKDDGLKVSDVLATTKVYDNKGQSKWR